MRHTSTLQLALQYRLAMDWAVSLNTFLKNAARVINWHVRLECNSSEGSVAASTSS